MEKSIISPNFPGHPPAAEQFGAGLRKLESARVI